jgi:hypothetical protein
MATHEAFNRSALSQFINSPAGRISAALGGPLSGAKIRAMKR